MTREIKTPADAEPREIYDETDKIEYYFTAAECAQIARAYATAFHKEIRANETGCIGIGESAAEWRAKFKEWLKD
jgi:hypothetical protein